MARGWRLLLLAASLLACARAQGSATCPPALPFRPCQVREAAANDTGNVFFRVGKWMDVSKRAKLAVALLISIGAFKDCNAENVCAIVDLGAGHELVRAALEEQHHAHITYLPVDWTRRAQHTIVCNLNSLEFPFDVLKPYNVKAFLMLGLFEYIVPKYALLYAVSRFPQALTILHYVWDHKRAFGGIEWVSPISRVELSIMVETLGGKAFFSRLPVDSLFTAVAFDPAIVTNNPTHFKSDPYTRNGSRLYLEPLVGVLGATTQMGALAG